MPLSREQILASKSLPQERVSVPEWEGDYYVRAMSARERDQFESGIAGADGKPSLANFRARLLVLCVCDESGARIFTDADADALGNTAAGPVQRLFNVASRLNRFGPEDVEELAGN